jgi:tetrahydromethanopterin S-methyltransferase subunit B
MPRKKLVRRFEPRFGVSQPMLDAEAGYVAKELEDHVLWSIDDLRKNLGEVHKLFGAAEQELQARLTRLPDRERLALRCMLARDVYHIASLYCTFFTSSPAVADATGPVRPAAEELDRNDEPKPTMLFKSSLFE